MYSGTTFHNKSGHLVGVHQRIDRIARRSLTPFLDGASFPAIREILHFEGKNGPDGIKRKRPGIDEPWHFIDPTHPEASELISMMSDHLHNLAVALHSDNLERAAFEAAWLAHTIVDGLTPAHHYPLEKKLTELRGEGIETRTSRKDKLLIPGATRRHQLRNNWEVWGVKGVMTTHLGFEMGVASALTGVTPGRVSLPLDDSTLVTRDWFMRYFYDSLAQIAAARLYERYSDKGWTRYLARETREFLIPTITRCVLASWRVALEEARS